MRAVLTFPIDTATMFLRKRSHRLEAQDAALSRPKPGFESPWEHLATKSPSRLSGMGLCFYVNFLHAQHRLPSPENRVGATFLFCLDAVNCPHCLSRCHVVCWMLLPPCNKTPFQVCFWKGC